MLGLFLRTITVSATSLGMFGAAVHEVVPSRGLLFRETSAQPVLCKPKLMPLQSISLEKLERLQAQQKTQQQQPPKSH